MDSMTELQQGRFHWFRRWGKVPMIQDVALPETADEKQLKLQAEHDEVTKEWVEDLLTTAAIAELGVEREKPTEIMISSRDGLHIEAAIKMYVQDQKSH